MRGLLQRLHRERKRSRDLIYLEGQNLQPSSILISMQHSTALAQQVLMTDPYLLCIAHKISAF